MRAITFRASFLPAAIASASIALFGLPARAQGVGNDSLAFVQGARAGLGIVPGARVRLIASQYGETPQVGRVSSVRGDSIVFRPAGTGDSVTLGLSHIAQLDLSEGRHAHALKGMGIGFASGAVIGATLGVAASQGCTGRGFSCIGDPGPGFGALAGGIVLGAGGALIGLIAGSVIHTEQWRTVPVTALLQSTHANISVIPSAAGPRMRLRVTASF